MLQQVPQVVKNLIILNVLMYVAAGLIGDAAIPLLAGTYPGSPFFQPWQVVTHMFMHGDPVSYTHLTLPTILRV